MTPPLDLGLLRTFEAVVDTGGFTRAAERIHLTQSTVSLQIKKLEERVGRVLLLRDRATGSVRPTEEGEVLLGYARRMLQISAEASEALRQPKRSVTVRLGVPEDFAGARLISLLSAFAASAPDIRLNTISGWSLGLRNLLDQSDLDLALVKREAGEGPCLGHWPEQLVWVGAEKAGLDFPSGDSVPLAVFPSGCIYRDRAIRAVDERGWNWRIAYASQGLMGVQAAVAGGLGISLLPVNAVLDSHYILESDALPAQRGTELALIAGARRMERHVQVLAEFLVAHIGTMRAAPV